MTYPKWPTKWLTNYDFWISQIATFYSEDPQTIRDWLSERRKFREKKRIIQNEKNTALFPEYVWFAYSMVSIELIVGEVVLIFLASDPELMFHIRMYESQPPEIIYPLSSLRRVSTDISWASLITRINSFLFQFQT